MTDNPAPAVQPETLSTRGVVWSPAARKLGGLQGWVTIFLALYIAAQLGLGVLYAVMLWWLNAPPPETSWVAMATGVVLAGSGYIGVLSFWLLIGALIGGVITYSLFVYRATRNLEHAHARGLAASAGWAVGWSFIPIVNLWKIFEVMRQIWIASRDPDRNRYPAPSYLPLWWIMWIAGSVANGVGNMIGRYSTDAEGNILDFGDFSAMSILAIVSSVFDIIACVLLMRVTKDIAREQDSRTNAARTTPT